MKYEYCIFFGDIRVSKIFQSLDETTIQLEILKAAYNEIDPSRWHIACREVSEWHFK
jgi:hypothetical protein